MAIESLSSVAPDMKRWVRRAASVVNGLLLGKANNIIDVTLTNGGVATVVTDPYHVATGGHQRLFGPDTFLVLVPVHMNASGDAITYQSYSVVAGVGQITIVHNAVAIANRNYKALVVGS